MSCLNELVHERLVPDRAAFRLGEVVEALEVARCGQRVQFERVPESVRDTTPLSTRQ